MAYGGDKMSCNFDDMLLYEYLDNLLDDNELLKLESHLSACGTCRRKLADIKLMYYELEHLDDLELPEEVEAIKSKIVSTAFENQKLSAAEKIRRTKKNLEQTPVVGALIPNKEKAKKVARSLYSGSKKIYKHLPRKKEKNIKKTPRKSLGGLL